jgi:hypothetical protein
MVEVNNLDLNDLCICALRYVLPRHTYTVSTICEIVKKHKESLTKLTKEVMLRDIRRELDYQAQQDVRHECDIKTMSDLFDELRRDL